MKYNKSGT